MASGLFRVTLLSLASPLFFLLVVCGGLGQAYAEEVSTEEWNIAADKLVRYEDPNSIVATGHVVLQRQEKKVPQQGEDLSQPTDAEYETTMTIKADWIVYDVGLQLIKAKGNLQITTKDDQVFAKEGSLSLVDETGNFTDATVLHQDSMLHLEGKKIAKTGPDTYRIYEGWAITCKLESGQTPPWSFASSDTDIRQGGYAVLKHARFNIRNVPVFYTPYLLLPVKNTRQTGFLFPELSSSENNGFGFNLPFFLNISDSADITFYPQYLADRGFMPGAEARYVLDATDKGIFTFNYLDDKLSDSSQTAYYSETGFTHDNSQRYWLRGKADHDFADWQTRLDLDIVSDQDYLTEFDTGATGFDSTDGRYLNTFGRGFQNETELLRQNSLKGLRSWDGMSLQTSLLAINDAHTNASKTDTPLWKLPSIDYTGVLPVEGTPLYFDWDANYVDYWREDGLGGHRLNLSPSIATPIPVSPYLESRAQATLHDTFYLVQTFGDAEWDNNDLQNRFFPEFEIETATTLERDYFADTASNRSYTHQVRPYIQYGYIPEVGQNELPQLDALDFVDDKNAITYGVDNYLNTTSHGQGKVETFYDLLEWKIEQSFDLRDEDSDRPFTDIFSELKLKTWTNTSLSYKTFYDVYDNEFNRHTFESLYSNSRGDYLGIDYSFNQEKDIEQLNGIVLAHLINGWLAGGSFKHSISQDETSEARGYFIYQAACWAVKLETKHTPTDTSYLMVFSLANIGFPLGLNF